MHILQSIPLEVLNIICKFLICNQEVYYTKPVLDIQDLIRFSWACGRVKKTAVFRAIFKMLQCEGGRWENSKSCWRLGVLMSGKERNEMEKKIAQFLKNKKKKIV